MTSRLVCKLMKALSGLKQAPRTWYDKMDNFLMSLGFTKSKAESNHYFKVEGGRSVMLLLYVDDMFLTREDELIVDAKRKLATEFEMKDLGMVHKFLKKFNDITMELFIYTLCQTLEKLGFIIKNYKPLLQG